MTTSLLPRHACTSTSSYLRANGELAYILPAQLCMVRSIDNVNHDPLLRHRVNLDVCHQLCPELHPAVGARLEGGICPVIADDHKEIVAHQILHSCHV